MTRTSELTGPGWVDAASAHWETVCRVERLQPGRGVAALLGDRQVALFRLDSRTEAGAEIVAIDNVDPISGASVLSRGIVGDRGGEPVVASPIYKQAFSLVTGRCMDEQGQEVMVYQVRVVDGWVQVELP
ncbi:nitrite reductase small subunit NirD [Pseudonocardia spinosispora]|uniref:nitrite reductase small subunit NirD n=1 Tax=Pseudonocardia spinosispora TaxID=103441 RepID=UPI0003FA1C75|nr:nitrite reductase small subunit NirD [Pseudonocardia spinosispora]